MATIRRASRARSQKKEPEAARAELVQRLEEVARSEPRVAREVALINELVLHDLLDELPADWCRRLHLPVRAANRSKAIVVEREISGRGGEPLVELDRVVFDQELREGAPGGNVWLEVALVHPAGVPSEYRCQISTRFFVADKEISSTIAPVQHRWSERFGAHFLKPGESKPYIASLTSGKVTRAYGARSRYRLADHARRIYQYLDVIAHVWDWYGADPNETARTVTQRIRDNVPSDALDLLVSLSNGGREAAQTGKPKLTVTLVKRVGEALGYCSREGARLLRSKPRPEIGETDQRLLPLVAAILAQIHRKPAATLLRTVVRPALLDSTFTGVMFESAERSVRQRL